MSPREQVLLSCSHVFHRVSEPCFPRIGARDCHSAARGAQPSPAHSIPKRAAGFIHEQPFMVRNTTLGYNTFSLFWKRWILRDKRTTNALWRTAVSDAHKDGILRSDCAAALSTGVTCHDTGVSGPFQCVVLCPGKTLLLEQVSWGWRHHLMKLLHNLNWTKSHN